MYTRSSNYGPAIALTLGTIAVGGLIAVSLSGAAYAHVTSQMTIRRPRMQVWGAWAPLVDLPKFLSHVETVEDLGGGRSRWVGKASENLGGTVEWIAEETEREEGRRIRWGTVGGQPLHQDGDITFEDAPNGRDTIVRLTLHFEPSASPAQAIASYLSGMPKALARNELKRFKSYLETGQISERAGRRKLDPISAEA